MGLIKGLKKIANSTLLCLVALLLISCSNIPDNYTGDGVNRPGLILPSGTIAIADNNYYTSSANVTITNVVLNGDEMRFSNDGVSWSSWESYSTTKVWTLATGHGEKTVYGQFRKIGGGTLDLSDTIIPLVEEKIVASDGAAGDYFGGGMWGFTTTAIALTNDGKTLFAGMRIRNRVYVYSRNNTGGWDESIINVPPPGSAPYSNFGQSLTCTPDGTYLVVGALGGLPGAVFVYKKTGGIYLKEATIESPLGINHDFGVNLSISDDGSRLIVGSWSSKKALVYEKSGLNWTNTHTFSGTTNYYGIGVRISGDGNTIIVGEPNDSAIGSVSVYKLNGGSWDFIVKLMYPGVTNDYFGRNIVVSADGSRILVGTRAWHFGTASAGTSYLYDWNGTTYLQSKQFNASDNQTNADDKFGYSVSMTTDGNTVVISAPGKYDFDQLKTEVGSFYVYKYNGIAWNEELKMIPTGSPLNHFFGNLIYISGDGSTIAAGAPYDDIDSKTDQGSVYLYY